MSKRPNPHGFDKSIREHITDFRDDRSKYSAFVERQLRDADELARLWPIAGVAFLLAKVEGERRLVRRYLRSRFGFKVARMGPNPSAGRFLKPERLPCTAEERQLCLHMMSEWAARETAFQYMYKVLSEITSHPCVDTHNAYRAVREEFRRGLDMISNFKVGLLLRTSYENKGLSDALLQEESIALFSAWVRVQINLHDNKRLKYYLTKGGHSPHTTLLEELPAATVIGCDNLVTEGKPPSKLRKEVTSPLEKAGSEKTTELARDSRRADSDPSEVTTSEPLLQEFLAKEELTALIASLKLSEREGQVLELRLKGRLYKEIASELGIADSSVKTYITRIGKKYEQVIGR